jgi:transcriptional regulator with XRE-family HTH domain
MGSDLGIAIKAKRERDGLSLRDAAAASGIAFSTLARIEGGANPSLKIDRLARSWLSGETQMLPMPAMTLRDWFAGQALAGLCANRAVIDSTAGQEFEAAAWCAFEIADAMLAERSAGQ